MFNSEFLQMFARRNFIILDTETTGLQKPAEIVQIALIDPDGVSLLNTLVKPKLPIPQDATNIHGITNDQVRLAPTWPTVKEWVKRYVSGEDIVVYNANYDRMMMHLSDEAWEMPRTDYKARNQWFCAMEAYAEHYGDWNDYRQSYRWQSLSNAIAQQGLVVAHDAHSALADCLMTLDLIKHCCKDAGDETNS